MHAAPERGVRVQMLLNTCHSADLCCPQRDLTLSVAALMRHAPKVEVYLTFPQRASSSNCRSESQQEHEPLPDPESQEAQTSEVPLLTLAEAKSYVRRLDDVRPSFVHAKYVVADSKVACLGSWNCWPRSAFYEHECNVLVEAPKLAAKIERKFDRAKLQNTVRVDDYKVLAEGGLFTPIGCKICRPFGPCLYSDELIEFAISTLAAATTSASASVSVSTSASAASV